MSHVQRIPDGNEPHNWDFSVIIVEDDDHTRRMLARIVADFGDPVPFACCDDALRFLSRPRPDLAAAIVDVVLPDGSGIDVLRHLRGTYGAVPTLVLTGCSDGDLMTQSQRLGADFLHKPPMSGDLHAFLQRAFSPRSLVARAVVAFADQHGLSEREREIVVRLAAGVEPTDLPEQLRLAPTSVKTLVRRLLRKSSHRRLGDVLRSVLRHASGKAS